MALDVEPGRTRAASDDDELRVLFASAFARARPGDDCPTPDGLLDALVGQGTPSARGAVIDHVAQCPVCAEAWRLASLSGERGAPRVDGEARARMVHQIRRVCPRWLRHQEEDLVQMAMVRLLRTTSVTDMRDAFLRRVAYSVVVDEIRRQKRRSEVAMSPSLPDRIANSGDLSPETLVRGAQIGQEVLDGLATLSTHRRRAVTLYLQDHQVPAVARMLGCDRKRASNLVYRGLSDLRDALRARGVVP